MIHLNQAASLAIIYIYRATFGEVTMINVEQVDNFLTTINDNLKEMNSKVYNLTPDYMIDPDLLFFIYGVDENKNGYYILKNDDESVHRRLSYVMGLPLDVVIASQKDNALRCIGLEMVDGEIIKPGNKILSREIK